MKNYAKKWIVQRLTALLLIPFTFWFVYSCVSFATMSYEQLIIFFKLKMNSFLFLVMMILTLLHAKIGCETITDDYVRSKIVKKISKLLINFLAYLLMIITAISILKLTFNQ